MLRIGDVSYSLKVSLTLFMTLDLLTARPESYEFPCIVVGLVQRVMSMRARGIDIRGCSKCQPKVSLARNQTSRPIHLG